MAATARQGETTRSSPAPITTHPYIGIAGVFLGAATSTLNGRLVSVGLPDLRGALGFSFDGASWIPTVLNMGMIFIGVFAVFLGAAYGIRRVLTLTGAVFTVASILLPFSPNLATMLALLAVAGMSSGAFYTLTLTFVARNLPPKLLLFGVAAYALDIVVTSNVAALIQGWYMDHFSWHWIFWTAAVLTPIMMLCTYFGIPPADEGPRPSWRGFLYTSAGLSLIYGALDQGQRLDWWRSGVFAGMLAGGSLLLIASLVRRYFQPNPLINLPFLNARNIVILGLGVFTIRFALLGPLAGIPGFLGSIQQYRPIQIGAALAWVAAPMFVLVWIAAITSVFIPPRIVMAAGFATVAIACWMAAHLDSSWAGGSFLVPELMLATGIAAAFVGLVVNLLMLAVEMGATTNVANTATYSAWMHTMRLMGGEIGAVIFGRFVAVREQLHSNLLGQHVNAGNWIADQRLSGVALALGPMSAGFQEAQARSAAILSEQVRAQALSLAYSDAFLLIAWTIAGFLLLLVVLRPSTISLRPQEKAK
jgi:MFS transporter, DHA2 family, multidrug resistance protein